MGTCYYIVDHEKKEKFDLGNNPNLQDQSVKTSLDIYIDMNIENVNEPPHIARKMLRPIWEWCAARNWKVEVISDADPKYEKAHYYEETGCIYLPEDDLWCPDDVLQALIIAAKDLRITMRAERIDIKIRVPDYEMDGNTQYHSTIADDLVEQGYYRVSRLDCGCGGPEEDE
jgi:hypothetical protein